LVADVGLKGNGSPETSADAKIRQNIRLHRVREMLVSQLVLAVALANKLARIAWAAVLAKGRNFEVTPKDTTMSQLA
jgi:hypothetical protein